MRKQSLNTTNIVALYIIYILDFFFKTILVQLRLYREAKHYSSELATLFANFLCTAGEW